MPLEGRVVVVTGASRGVGRGVAAELARQRATVIATGRTIAAADLPANVVRAACDHTDDASIDALFERIASDYGRCDALVNSAWGGYERMVEDGAFTWAKPFWEQPTWRWSAMIDAGVRAAFVASQQAARMMVREHRGLIVNVSHWAAQKHIGNAIYGIAKAATDKLTADIAHELEPFGIAAISLYPGLVRTEAVLAAGVFDLSRSESPEFSGRAIAALMTDAELMALSGTVQVAAKLAQRYGFSDIDGKQPPALTIEEV